MKKCNTTVGYKFLNNKDKVRSQYVWSLCILLILVSCNRDPNCEAEFSRNPVKITVLIGQSNADGYGAVEDLDEQYLAATNGHICSATSNGVEELQPGLNNTIGSERHGIEVSYIDCIKNCGGDPYLIKFATGGTALCAVADKDDWNISSSGELFDQSLTHIDNCMADLKAKGIEPIISEFIWIHGTYDSCHEPCETEYESNLMDLINAYRSHLNDDDILFKITLLPNSHPCDNKRITNDAKNNVSNRLPNIKIYSTNSISLKDDDVHFDSKGFIELGNLLCE